MGKKNQNTRIIARLAFLIAMSTILKVFLSFTLQEYRFTFYDVPLMVIGMMFGPLAGGLSGFAVDSLNIVYPNLATGYNLMTVSSMLWGIIPGLFLYNRKITIKNLIPTVLLTSAICFGINTYQLQLWFGDVQYHWIKLAPRVVTAIIKVPVQIYVLKVLYDRVLRFDLQKLQKNYEVA